MLGHFLLSRKLLTGAAATARINEAVYWKPYWTNKKRSINWTIAQAKKLRVLLLDEKFLSSNVQILLRKKFEVIDKIIPIVEACIYHKFETIPFVNIIESI
jgi:hypothetical protein